MSTLTHTELKEALAQKFSLPFWLYLKDGENNDG